jgi:putative ABC transport system permease protein
LKLRRFLGPSVKALLAHSLRALLAAASIAMGVVSVLVTTGVGNGARAEVDRSLGSMATDFVVVRPAEVKRLVARRMVRGVVPTLKREDAAAIAALPSVAAVSPTVEANALVKSESASTRAGVLGTGPAYAALRRFRVARGRTFDEEDARASARVAVLGARVAQSLFGSDDPIGRTIRVRTVPFEVIGVLQARGASGDGADQDGLVAVPLETALRRLLNATSLSSILVRARDEASTPKVGPEIRRLLRERHRLDARGAPDDFGIQGQERMVSMQRKTARSLSLLTTGLSAVALAVGGAGVLALMLISVRERTAEIGLRMAVGATPRDILLQFLGEAALLAFAGGAAGVVLGTAGALTVAAATGWKVAVPAAAVAASLATALATGLVSGAVPAWLASRVPPIEALSSR